MACRKSHIKKQLGTGLSLRSKRALTGVEISNLRREYARLDALTPKRVAHATAQADRVIEAVRQEVAAAVVSVDARRGAAAGGEEERAAPASPVGNELYIMRNPRIPGEVKIGRSNNVDLRRAALSSQMNFDMVVEAVFFGLGPLESRVHDALQHRRSREGPGREWFNVDVTGAIEAIKTTARASGQALTSCFMRTTLTQT